MFFVNWCRSSFLKNQNLTDCRKNPCTCCDGQLGCWNWAAGQIPLVLWKTVNSAGWCLKKRISNRTLIARFVGLMADCTTILFCAICAYHLLYPPAQLTFCQRGKSRMQGVENACRKIGGGPFKQTSWPLQSQVPKQEPDRSWLIWNILHSTVLLPLGCRIKVLQCRAKQVRLHYITLH